MTFQELETTIKKNMLLADQGVVKLICAFVIAARLPINPPWLFIVGSSSGGKALTPDHEVLTDKGWKFIGDIKVGDRVLAWDLPRTRQTNGDLKYAKVKGISENQHDGLIYTSNQHVNFKASPDHRWYMSFQNKNGRNWRIVRSPDLTKNSEIPATGNPVELTDSNYSAEEMELMGWYIAEGSKSRKSILISQSKVEGKNRIRYLLGKLGLPYYESPKSFYFKWDLLFECGNNCYEKFVPRELMNEIHLPALLKGLIQGDGSYRREGWEYYSASKQLIDDVQEIAVKLGYRTRISPKKVNYKYRSSNDTSIKIKNGKGMFPGHLVKNYRISAYKRDVWSLPKLKTEHYKGKTYCLWVPGPGTFVARYKGTPFVTGNSMLLSCLENVMGAKKVDDLTSNTFASGMRARQGEKSASLLDDLNGGTAILVFRDFTTIISKEKESRAMIIGQMRKIYDGDFTKKTGNGMEVQWKGKVSVIAGVTSKIFTTMYAFADMGERFLQYVFTQPDRMAMAMLSTSERKNLEIQAEMTNAFQEFIDNVPIPAEIPVLDAATKQEIAELAEFVTRARSPIERNEMSREKEVRQKHFLEMPGRFTTQLMSIAYGLFILNGNSALTIADKKIIYKLALDSVPNIRRVCLQELTHFAKVQTSGLAVKLHYPVSVVKLHLQDLAMLEVIDWQKKGKGQQDEWEIHPVYRRIMSKYDDIEMSPEMLLGEDAEVDDYLSYEETSPTPTENITPAAQHVADLMGGQVI